MPAVARRVAAPEPVITKTTPVRVERPDDVLIHVRFHPNADVALVDGERPQHISLKDWYMRLRLEAADCYRTFAGGRGFFRIPRETFDAIVSKAAVDSSLKAGLASPDWNTSPPR